MASLEFRLNFSQLTSHPSSLILAWWIPPQYSEESTKNNPAINDKLERNLLNAVQDYTVNRSQEPAGDGLIERAGVRHFGSESRSIRCRSFGAAPLFYREAINILLLRSMIASQPTHAVPGNSSTESTANSEPLTANR